MIRSHPLRSLLTLAALLAGLAGTASAQPLPQESDGWAWWPGDEGTFSYTYVQGRADYYEFDPGGDGLGYQGRVALNLWKPVYVRADYDFIDASSPDYETTSYLGAIGLHASLAEHIDFFIEGGYTVSETDLEGGGSVDGDGPLASFGFRGLSPEGAVEGEFRYDYQWLSFDGGGSDDFGVANFDLIWRVTDHIGLVGGASVRVQSGGSIPVQSYGGGLRFMF